MGYPWRGHFSQFLEGFLTAISKRTLPEVTLIVYTTFVKTLVVLAESWAELWKSGSPQSKASHDCTEHLRNPTFISSARNKFIGEVVSGEPSAWSLEGSPLDPVNLPCSTRKDLLKGAQSQQTKFLHCQSRPIRSRQCLWQKRWGKKAWTLDSPEAWANTCPVRIHCGGPHLDVLAYSWSTFPLSSYRAESPTASKKVKGMCFVYM